MDWSSQLNKTPYLVLFAMLISIGMNGVYALTVTLDGDLISYLGILDMNTNKITNVGDPILPSDAATKAYVDSSFETDTLALLSCTTDQIASWDGLNWVCSNPNFEPNETLNMNTNKITNVGDPTLPTDVATKAYVDSSFGADTLALLSCTTDQIASWDGLNWACSNPDFEPNETLNMNTNKITNVGDPTLPSDAATKAYVDSSQPYDILLTLSCSVGEVPKWHETQWECSEI